MIESKSTWLCGVVAASMAMCAAALSAAATESPTNGPATATTSAPAAGGARQWWKGVITIPGMPLDFVVVFTPGEAGWSARLDIPLQGAKELALSDVVVSADELRFRIPAPADAEFQIDRAKDGASGSGVMHQKGMTFPVTVEKITEAEAAAVGPPRPQTPKPPFPYQVREVSYRNSAAAITLAGTLTLPEGEGPHQVVLMISGSGPQDRDETLFGHKPFAVLADHLTRRGFATLRVDDRGVGGSGGNVMDSTSEDFAGDARAGIEFLRSQPEIDRGRIILLGHSEGGLVAPMVAARGDGVAGLVLLAPQGLPGREILALQMTAMLKAAGSGEAETAEQVETQQKLLRQVTDGAPEAEARATLERLIELQMAGTPSSKPDPVVLKSLAEAQWASMNSRWMKFFIAFDPRDVLTKVRVPVLAIWGERDLQVPPRENEPALRKALDEAQNAEVTCRALPGLNHLLQDSQTGLVAEYAAISQTIAPAALEEISSWLERFAPRSAEGRN